MKKRNKVLGLMVGAVALVGVSIMGTMAYLTSTTDTVNNTFTVGRVEITLDEASVDLYGVEIPNAARVDHNTYKLIPGHEYKKDPTVHVADDSEDSWLFVKVENGISDIEADTKIASQMKTIGWTLVDGETDVYAYKETVSENQDVVVFNNFTLTGTADVETYKDASIKITAYAVQADGFGTAAEAWTKAPATWTE